MTAEANAEFIQAPDSTFVRELTMPNSRTIDRAARRDKVAPARVVSVRSLQQKAVEMNMCF